jgi:hypothetical protein
MFLVLSQFAEGATGADVKRKWIVYGAAAVAVLAVVGYLGIQFILGSTIRQLTNGKLVAADYWSNEPSILSAGYGFDNIVGLRDLTEETVRAVGGAWYSDLKCTNGKEPDATLRTSASIAGTIGQAFKGYADVDDGLPIVFSWPVATETVDASDFKFVLNTGETVFPHAAGMYPNWENNERNTVVVFGDFGNRGKSGEADAIFPVKLEIVADATPLLLVGAGGREFNAVGLTWSTNKSPYDEGPKLVGAKLNRVGRAAQGEGGVALMAAGPPLPNDEFALYGGGDFRLRVLTTGGFSPDGITGLRPDMFADFFRLHVRGPEGETVFIDKTNVDFAVAGGKLRVVGLSDLGQIENPSKGVFYDDCYVEDADNYIDIILTGDEAAARNIAFVEIPSLAGGYRAFYNPGGPGPTPTERVRSTAPGPADLEPVVMALDDPMRVDRR